VLKLFELEVPEIAEGQVEIKHIAREPGSRAKIAVVSYQDGIDPIGAVVGQRGTRVMAVTNELGNEKIDVIEWSEESEEFIANALSPAKVKFVEALPRREARVLVPEDQLSLAIGRSGQNVRLAAKLTGWKIDVRSQSRPDEVQEGGIAEVEKEEADGEEGDKGASDSSDASVPDAPDTPSDDAKESTDTTDDTAEKASEAADKKPRKKNPNADSVRTGEGEADKSDTKTTDDA
jgi:N utilization substance protein A